MHRDSRTVARLRRQQCTKLHSRICVRACRDENQANIMRPPRSQTINLRLTDCPADNFQVGLLLCTLTN